MKILKQHGNFKMGKIIPIAIVVIIVWFLWRTFGLIVGLIGLVFLAGLVYFLVGKNTEFKTKYTK